MKPNNNIHFVGYHQYALYFWFRYIEKAILRRNSLLIHIDLHSDFLDPRDDSPEIISSKHVLEKISHHKIRHDSFIVPALNNGIVNEVIFCCNAKQNNDYGQFKNLEFPENVIKQLSSINTRCRDIILNVDIDYFLNFQSDRMKLFPMSDSEITKHMDFISCLSEKASITTIATSPEIFGEENDWRKTIFNKVLEKIY